MRVGGRHSAEDEGVPAPQPGVPGQDVRGEGHQQAVGAGQGTDLPPAGGRAGGRHDHLRQETGRRVPLRWVAVVQALKKSSHFELKS